MRHPVSRRMQDERQATGKPAGVPAWGWPTYAYEGAWS
jgi:hypothetical protein